MSFDYEKAYCTQALPAFNALPERLKTLHKRLAILVKDKTQDSTLNIPMTTEMKNLLVGVAEYDIAKLSYISYFIGHWKCKGASAPFDNSKGQAWKVSNVCDQALRNRLSLPSNLTIQEGTFRVVFSNHDSWIAQVFALATPTNLFIFKNCGLLFDGDSLENSANKLKKQIGDLWGTPDDMPVNDEYRKVLADKKVQTIQKIVQTRIRKTKHAERDIIAAKKEEKFLLLCIDHDVSIENVYYYPDKDAFLFTTPSRAICSEAAQQEIITKLGPAILAEYTIIF